MTIAEVLARSAEYLEKQRIESPRLEAELLLAHSLGLKRIGLFTQFDRVLSEEEMAKARSLLQRRARHEPTAYITGVQPFMSLDFFVDRSVLIPRPETEELVEYIISSVRNSALGIQHLTIADIGTGSGAIAVSLAKFLPNIKVIATDISPAALAIARQNAEFHHVADRCEFRLGDLLEPLTEKVDIIVSNPPYIPTAVIETLQPEVRDWEPKGALDGGEDGLDHIRTFLEKAPDHLQPDGRLFIEGDDFARLNSGQLSLETINDLSGKGRFLDCSLAGETVKVINRIK